MFSVSFGNKCPVSDVHLYEIVVHYLYVQLPDAKRPVTLWAYAYDIPVYILVCINFHIVNSDWKYHPVI